MKKLKVASYTVAMQEVPNEVSLIFNISGCPYKCKGCHSTYLWEYIGFDLTDNFKEIYDKYSDLISCVCFMGGDQNKDELIQILSLLKEQNVKTCLYTGQDELNKLTDIIPFLDYIKIGHYSELHGGLNKETTNQRMYEKKNGELIDITYKFYKEIGGVN